MTVFMFKSVLEAKLEKNSYHLSHTREENSQITPLIIPQHTTITIGDSLNNKQINNYIWYKL